MCHGSPALPGRRCKLSATLYGGGEFSGAVLTRRFCRFDKICDSLFIGAAVCHIGHGMSGAADHKEALLFMAGVVKLIYHSGGDKIISVAMDK